jgi:hypothetical protein
MYATGDQKQAIIDLYLRAIMDYKFAHGLIEGTYRLDNSMHNQALLKTGNEYPSWIKTPFGDNCFDDLITLHHAQRDKAALAGLALQDLARALDIDLPLAGSFYLSNEGNPLCSA